MSLFICEDCGHVENTATSYYWMRNNNDHGGRVLCSDCDPQCQPHNLFEREPWDGQLVLNPELVGRFTAFKCATDKCSHLSLGDAGRYHLGAKHVCKDCGTFAEIVDIGRERRAWEHDSRYRPEDYKWKALA